MLVGGFIFLRFICPALLNPVQMGIYDKPLNGDAVRVLILVSKIVQNLANGIDSNSKEECKS
jgi:neurofibromin 1